MSIFLVLEEDTAEEHIETETRVINFLIYLNNLTTKDGGYLRLFNLKK